MPATYTLIASNTLSSAAASVTFSAIPGTYTDLVLSVTGRTDINNDNGDSLRIRLNNATSSTSRTFLQGFATGATSGRSSGGNTNISAETVLVGDTATASTFSSAELYFPSYTSSANKVISAYGVTENNASGIVSAYIATTAMLYQLTSAIDTILLSPANAANFKSGSSFFLYGIKSS
jgi:hypothetical protein